MKPIFLIGFMATGKTTVGRLVARRAGLEFEDLDETIVASAGMPVVDIFRTEGEAGFRRREADALARACQRHDAVVATGGGAACREENLVRMLGAGPVVALSATPGEVLRRAGGGAGRPLLDTNPQETVRATAEALLAAREPFYARATHRIDTIGRSPDDVASAVIAALGLGA